MVSFFDRFQPLTAGGQTRYAEALAATGRSADARSNAARAWVTRGLSVEDEARASLRERATRAGAAAGGGTGRLRTALLMSTTVAAQPVRPV